MSAIQTPQNLQPENPWSPTSWKGFTAKQQPNYVDPDTVTDVTADLSTKPPLIFAGEARRLKQQLADVSVGKAFLLQGGDCAETFADFKTVNIRDTYRVLLQMAVVLTFAASRPVVKIARMAGQFAKPRSDDMETIEGVALPSYRGDIINGFDFTGEARIPDPHRMMQCYYQSAATLNLLRAFSQGGYADLTRLHRWTLDFVQNSPQGAKYEDIANRLDEVLAFMKAIGVTPENTPQLRETDFYTSHEALLLPYEQALTRVDSTSGDWYDTSAHFLWIGERTRQLDGAHVEFMRGVKNPIGVKCGPTMAADDVLRMCDVLNPTNEAGRLTLIIRQGRANIEKAFPEILRRITSEGRNVVWVSDPMHGNTIKTASGYKTRRFDDVLAEVKSFLAIHKAEGTHAGGIHFELTGLDVTECVGGAQGIGEEKLFERYYTQCDPRLNASQALEMVFQIVDELKDLRA